MCGDLTERIFITSTSGEQLRTEKRWAGLGALGTAFPDIQKGV